MTPQGVALRALRARSRRACAEPGGPAGERLWRVEPAAAAAGPSPAASPAVRRLPCCLVGRCHGSWWTAWPPLLGAVFHLYHRASAANPATVDSVLRCSSWWTAWLQRGELVCSGSGSRNARRAAALFKSALFKSALFKSALFRSVESARPGRACLLANSRVSAEWN